MCYGKLRRKERKSKRRKKMRWTHKDVTRKLELVCWARTGYRKGERRHYVWRSFLRVEKVGEKKIRGLKQQQYYLLLQMSRLIIIFMSIVSKLLVALWAEPHPILFQNNDATWWGRVYKGKKSDEWWGERQEDNPVRYCRETLMWTLGNESDATPVRMSRMFTIFLHS